MKNLGQIILAAIAIVGAVVLLGGLHIWSKQSPR
jgi:hypothetical protein